MANIAMELENEFKNYNKKNFSETGMKCDNCQHYINSLSFKTMYDCYYV